MIRSPFYVCRLKACDTAGKNACATIDAKRVRYLGTSRAPLQVLTGEDVSLIQIETERLQGHGLIVVQEFQARLEESIA